MKNNSQKLQNQIDNFNSKYKVGDKVEVEKYKGSKDVFVDVIKHEATIMGGHTAMTWLENKGCYDLTFVKGKQINS